jgi:hypothetical protein
LSRFYVDHIQFPLNETGMAAATETGLAHM